MTRSFQSIAEILETVDTPSGRERLQRFLDTQPFPHYKSGLGKHGMLVRISEDGSRTLGRFVNREFRPEFQE